MKARVNDNVQSAAEDGNTRAGGVPQHPPLGAFYYLRQWTFGLVIATLAMWAVSWNFLDQFFVFSWDAKLAEYAPTPGSSARHRSEGWATTQFGMHRVPAIEDFTASPAPKVSLWGNSHVMALEVPDDVKAASQVSRIWSEQESAPLMCVSVAWQGRKIAEYYEYLPKYEVLADFQAHYILVSTVRELLPDEDRFRTSPTIHFRPKREDPRFNESRRVISEMGLEFLARVVNNVRFQDGKRIPRHLRFGLGCVTSEPVKGILTGGEKQARVAPVEAWEYLCRAFRQRTTNPLIFIYAPKVPRLEKGQVRFDDTMSDLAEVFAAICAQHNIRFLDMRPRFCASYRESKRFPRGFQNGVPGRGHINAYGQALIAEAMVTDIREHRYVIHAN